MVAREEGGLKGWVQKVKGLRITDWQSQNSHGDVKYSRENIVTNTVTTVNSNWWIPEYPGGTLYKVYDRLTTLLYT